MNFLGVVTPTVKALELLEKLADERSKLIEDNLTLEKMVESLKRRQENKDSKSPEVLNKEETQQMDNYFEQKLKTKTDENIKLQRVIAENKINEANQHSGKGYENMLTGSYFMVLILLKL